VQLNRFLWSGATTQSDNVARSREFGLTTGPRGDSRIPESARQESTAEMLLFLATGAATLGGG
jgi:hypothetical protein